MTIFKHFLKISAFAILLLAACSGYVLAVEDFEYDATATPNYTVGDSINGYTDWTLNLGAATISNEAFNSVNQSLKLAGQITVADVSYTLDVSTLNALPAENIIFTDMWIKPVADDSIPALYSIDAYGSLVGFVLDTGSGKIMALNGNGDGAGGGTDETTGYTFSLAVNSNKAASGFRITLRQDFDNLLWDVYLDGKLYTANLGYNAISPITANFSIFGDDAEDAYMDDFQVVSTNPLFTDADRDGIPDDFETAHGMNTASNDRDGDLDGDTLTNLQEFMSGKLPDVHDYNGINGYLYVDNAVGNDTNDGLASVVNVGGSGPKATVSGAVSTAVSGDTVLVLPGTGLYDETTWDVTTKSITLKPVGAISIQ